MIARTRVRLFVLLICACAAGYALWSSPNRHRFVDENHYPYLRTTFDTWDRTKVSQHLLLSFLEDDDFERGRAYWHTTPVWLVMEYAVLKPIRLFGIGYGRAQSFLWVAYFPLLLFVTVAHLGAIERHANSRPRVGSTLTFLTVLLALACLSTLPSFWAGFVLCPDRNSSVAFVALTSVAALDFNQRGRGRAAFIAVLIAVSCSTYMAPFVVAPFIALFYVDGTGQDAIRPRRRWWWRVAVLCGATAVSVALPWLMVRVGGFEPIGSSFAFRSGLDGSQRYFTSVLQAVWNPIEHTSQRQWHFLPLPVAALAGILAVAMVSRVLALRMARQFFISLVPYLCLVTVFPQSVSIHPDVFDFGVLFPAAFCLAFWLSRPEIEALLERHRAVMLAVLIALVGLVLTNYIDLARFK